MWTGHELLIWSGAGDRTGSCSWPFADGAAYDPTARTWRTLPEAPVDQRVGHAAVGPETGCWADEHRGDVTGSAAGATVLWVGDRLLVWGGERPREQYHCIDYGCEGLPSSEFFEPVHLYDPAAGSWASTAQAPVARRSGALASGPAGWRCSTAGGTSSSRPRATATTPTRRTAGACNWRPDR